MDALGHLEQAGIEEEKRTAMVKATIELQQWGEARPGKRRGARSQVPELKLWRQIFNELSVMFSVVWYLRKKHGPPRIQERAVNVEDWNCAGRGGAARGRRAGEESQPPWCEAAYRPGLVHDICSHCLPVYTGRNGESARLAGPEARWKITSTRFSVQANAWNLMVGRAGIEPATN